MTSSKEFISARSKVHRANRHIHEFMNIVTAFLQTDFCKLVAEEDSNTGRYSLKIDAAAPFPAEIPLIVGDAVHNLRSALDHVIVNVTGIDVDGLSFPAGKKRYDVEFKSSSYRTIKEALPDFAEFILNEIQPYAGGKFKVWELGKLDNIDKHKLIIPTINISSLMDFEIEDEHRNIFKIGHASVLQGRVQGLIAGHGQVKINKQGKPATNVQFGSGTPFENQSVFETLPHLSQLVLEAIAALELFCFGEVPNPDPSKGTA